MAGRGSPVDLDVGLQTAFLLVGCDLCEPGVVAEPGQLVYIEQPEIHLHPKAQIVLAELLADAANRGVRVVAETHSALLLLAVQALVAEQKLEHIQPGDTTRSRVHYRNLYRYTRAFVAGTLTCARNGIEDCVAGASLSLTQGAERIAEADSDDFGDFRIDGLLPQARNLRLRIAAAGYREQVLDIDMDNSRWLGEIRLAPA